MPVSANSGEYRSCPFCAELIRGKAIRCKHCNAALDPKKIRRYNRLRAAKGWHLMLGLLIFVAVFTGIYPRVAAHLEKMEHADRSAEGRARHAPQLAGPAPPAMPVPRLPLGEEELVAGQSYNGGVLLDLIESNFEIAEIEPDKSIRVSVDGREYLIRTKKAEFSRASNYEIVGIEAVEK